MRGVVVLALTLFACGDSSKPSGATDTSRPVPREQSPKQICSLDYAKEKCPIPLEDECVAAVMRPWTVACRREVFNEECKDRCFSYETDEIIMAAATSEERRGLLVDRVERNKRSIALADDLYTRSAKFFEHAKSLIGKPRGDACFRRIKADFATVDGLVEEVKDKAARLPTGMISLGGSLIQAKNCVHCSDDASSKELCAEAIAQFKEDAENIDQLKADVKTDEATLKALR